jgi:Fe-S-cluster containining protein
MVRPTDHAAFGRRPDGRSVDIDAPVEWGCSLKGWNCCVGTAIEVRPYDMIRLRHALRRPAHEIAQAGLVQFAWHPERGTLSASLAHEPFEGGPHDRGAMRCTFLEVLTNLDLQRMRAEQPERFAAPPERLRDGADSTAAGEHRVGAICGVHDNRPSACRTWPLTRRARLATRDGEPPEAELAFLSACRGCQLSTPTTVRELAGGEEVAEHWRADDTQLAAFAYLYSIGCANVEHPQYRALPIEEVGRIWAAMFVPDADAEIAARHPEQWLALDDRAGDRTILAAVLERAMDRAEELAASRGEDLAALGPTGVQARRPQLTALLDPARSPAPLGATRAAEPAA